MNRSASNHDDLDIKPGASVQTDSAADAHLPWHRPTVSLIDIRRTLLSGGSATDFALGSGT